MYFNTYNAVRENIQTTRQLKTKQLNIQLLWSDLSQQDEN